MAHAYISAKQFWVTDDYQQVTGQVVLSSNGFQRIRIVKVFVCGTKQLVGRLSTGVDISLPSVNACSLRYYLP